MSLSIPTCPVDLRQEIDYNLGTFDSILLNLQHELPTREISEDEDSSEVNSLLALNQDIHDTYEQLMATSKLWFQYPLPSKAIVLQRKPGSLLNQLIRDNLGSLSSISMLIHDRLPSQDFLRDCQDEEVIQSLQVFHLELKRILSQFSKVHEAIMSQKQSNKDVKAKVPTKHVRFEDKAAAGEASTHTRPPRRARSRSPRRATPRSPPRPPPNRIIINDNRRTQHNTTVHNSVHSQSDNYHLHPHESPRTAEPRAGRHDRPRVAPQNRPNVRAAVHRHASPLSPSPSPQRATPSPPPSYRTNADESPLPELIHPSFSQFPRHCLVGFIVYAVKPNATWTRAIIKVDQNKSQDDLKTEVNSFLAKNKRAQSDIQGIKGGKKTQIDRILDAYRKVDWRQERGGWEWRVAALEVRPDGPNKRSDEMRIVIERAKKEVPSIF